MRRKLFWRDKCVEENILLSMNYFSRSLHIFFIADVRKKFAQLCELNSLRQKFLSDALFKFGNKTFSKTKLRFPNLIEGWGRNSPPS